MKKIPYTETILNFAISEPGGIISWADSIEMYRTVYKQNWGHFPLHENYKKNIGKILKKFFVHVDGEGSRGLYVLKFKLYPHESNDILHKKPEKLNGLDCGKTYMCDSCLRKQPFSFGADDNYPEVCDDCWFIIESNK